MKRQSFHTSERGFFLPYVVVIALICISIVTTSLFVYETDLTMTHLQIEQIVNDTLIQKGRASFLQEAPYIENDSGEVNYYFLDGTVSITYEQKEYNNVYSLIAVVETTDGTTFRTPLTVRVGPYEKGD